MTFDVRCQHASRRPRGPKADTARIDKPDTYATRRELVGDGAAGDAGSHDGDVHITDFSWWLVVGGWWLAGVAGGRRWGLYPSYEPPTTIRQLEVEPQR